jgi:N-acetylglucosaminyldiphosphoundecaprenol N-acetyl-beta-D-mannosaminyltransferase
MSVSTATPLLSQTNLPANSVSMTDHRRNAHPSDPRYRQILGTRFFFGEVAEAVARGLDGGLVVFPAAPLLATLAEDTATQAALAQSDLALPDSGLMVLLWNFLHRERLRRLSGLEYMSLFLARPEIRRARAVLWVMPTPAALQKNLAWLQANGHVTTREDCYLAPLYPGGPIADAALLRLVQERRPAHVVMAIGGGVQERLGLYLRQHLDYRPGIHCTGAAIGFLSGEQANIPPWADRYYLGWLARCWQNPGRFIPRYWAARKLCALIMRFGASSPRADFATPKAG